MSSSAPSSRVVLRVHSDALIKNFDRIRQAVKPSKVMAILKANAYGLGALKVGEILARAGVDRIGVAELKEAIPLVRSLKLPVQILGSLFPEEMEECIRRGIICPVGDLDSAKKLSRLAARIKKPAIVHIKVDTGMGRLGLPYAQAQRDIQSIAALPHIKLEGMYSHFPNANNPDHGKTREQLTLFQELMTSLSVAGVRFPLVHIANSDAINNFPDAYFNMVRTGINLYGVFDLEGRQAYRLKPTLSLTTRLLAKRILPAGHTIGYGCTHVLFRETAVGTIPAGYADGIPLAASNSGRVLIRGKWCPIIGRVSMDYITVDLSSCPDCRTGDEVVLVGRSGRHEITIEDWARIKQTHPYDIICGLGNRVERMFV